MAKRRDRSDEIREIGRALFRLMREHEAANHTRLKVGGPLSHILGHVPEWRALRLRDGKGGEEGEERLAKDPAFFTLLDAAKELNVPICAFVPTAEHQPLTDLQRKLLTLAGRWMLANFAARHEERAAYTSDFDDFEAYVTFEKVEYATAASRVGTDEQLGSELAEVLASIPGIPGERLQVTTVRGDSMADRLHHGDRVLVDVHRRTPRNGEMIAVDRGHLGRTIGYWRGERKRSFLDKENEPAIDLGSPSDFTILGTITAVVWSPIRPRSR
jgi:phage repressor protein C with HTH and peptisase S24 domain